MKGHNIRAEVTFLAYAAILKYGFPLILLFLLIGCFGTVENTGPIPDQDSSISTHLVAYVSDGDSIVLRYAIKYEFDGEIKYINRIRYIGIDAPEYNEPYYQAAKALNKSLVHGKRIRLELDKERVDRYNRLLAYVYVGDTFVNAEMVRRGYARAVRMEPNTKYADLFQQLEREAREQRRGMWVSREISQDAGSDPQAEESEAATEAQEHRYVASKNSDVFHVPSCQWVQKIAEENKVYFSTYKEGIDSGRRPCRVCRPDEGE